MLALNCLIVDDGSVFEVEIEETRSVGKLKDLIKAKKKNTITCDADQLQLWKVDGLLKRSDRTTFLFNGQPILSLDDVDLAKTELALDENVISDERIASQPGHIHVLVKLPEQAQLTTPQAIGRKRKVHPRQSRWNAINSITNHKRTKKYDSVAYSNSSWPQLKPIFEGAMADYAQEFDENAVATNKEVLMSYLEFCTTSLRHVLTGQEAHRVHLIMPILVCVCALFQGDVKILVEEDVYGERVRVHGHFEFVLERKGKKVCIVEAKMDDFEQGLAQDLLGCEAVADLEDSDIVYGVVTNYLDWIFIRSCNDKIWRDDCCLNFDQDSKRPTDKSVAMVAGKIHALLRDDDE